MAALNLYNVGDLVRLTGNLTTAAGVATDPAALTVTVQSPTGTQTQYVYQSDEFPIRAEAGEFYVDVTPTVAGKWAYQFRSTGTGQAMDEGEFEVEPPRIVVQGG